MTSTQRLRRAAVAQRLLTSAPQAAASLDWDTLGHAPDWLALPDHEWDTFQCRVGAVLCGRELRMWIDRRRLDAAQSALGAPFLRALLAESDSASSPSELPASLRMDAPAQVHAALRQAGASVLLATLRHGALRDAVDKLLAPATASSMTPALARALVAHAQSLDTQAQRDLAAPQAVEGAAP